MEKGQLNPVIAKRKTILTIAEKSDVYIIIPLNLVTSNINI